MTIEARKPPPQFVVRLKRALGGRAGWTGFALQILFVAALVWIGYEIVANARANLQAQRITSGFGFLANTAGFDVSQSLIPYSGSCFGISPCSAPCRTRGKASRCSAASFSPTAVS